MVVGEGSSIQNIMGGLEAAGGVKQHSHKKKLRQRFDIIKKLGQGTFGKVQLGINKETGQEVAIKTIKKSKIESEADLIRIRREIQIMSSVQHPNIIHIYEVFENREKMVLVMEYAAGGELYDYLSERKVLLEDEARRIFRQIATACFYCHKHKICHRDLKLENILLDENNNAKIADFGLSNVFDDQRLLNTFCGSPLYASPEIVKGTPYIGPEVDCWSLGVLLYTLVYGAMPFDGSNFKRLVKQISTGGYFEPAKPSAASPLIRAMLTVNAQNRADIETICSHWWVNESYSDSCLDISEELANQTPVRLDLLLSLAPPPETDKLVITTATSNTDQNNGMSDVPVAPQRSQSAGNLSVVEDKPTVLTQKRKFDNTTMSNINIDAANSPDTKPIEVIEEGAACVALLQQSFEVPKENTEQEKPVSTQKPKKKLIKKKVLSDRNENNNNGKKPTLPMKTERRKSKIIEAAEKFQNLDGAGNSNVNSGELVKPKKIIIPGVSVDGFKKEFERKASLTSTTGKVPASNSSSPVKNDRIKTAVSIISSALDNSGGRSKSKSQVPTSIRKPPVPFGTAGRSSTGTIPKPFVRSSITDDSTEKTSSAEIILKSATLPRRKSSTVNPTATSTAQIQLNYPPSKQMEFKTEVVHRVEGPPQDTLKKERIIPIEVEDNTGTAPPVTKPPSIRRIVAPRSTSLSRQSTIDSDSTTTTSSTTGGGGGGGGGEPIRKSPREYIIPIAVEGGGYITPRSSSLEPPPPPSEYGGTKSKFKTQHGKRVNSFLSTESEEESTTFPSSTTSSHLHRHHRRLFGRDPSTDRDDSSSPSTRFHMHRLRSTRPPKRSLFDKQHGTDSISSAEDDDDDDLDDDDDDDGFEILTAENLFSTLLARVRDLTQRLNVEHTSPSTTRPNFPASRLLHHFDHGSNFWNRIDPLTRHSSLRRRDDGTNSSGIGTTTTTSSSSHHRSSSIPWRRGATGATTKLIENDTSENLNKPTATTTGGDDDGDLLKQQSPSMADDSLHLDESDFRKLRLSDDDARALSYLTPGLSRRIQRQLWAQLTTPSNGTKLKRTLSTTTPSERPKYTRSYSSTLPRPHYHSHVNSASDITTTTQNNSNCIVEEEEGSNETQIHDLHTSCTVPDYVNVPTKDTSLVNKSRIARPKSYPIQPRFGSIENKSEPMKNSQLLLQSLERRFEKLRTSSKPSPSQTTIENTVQRLNDNQITTLTSTTPGESDLIQRAVSVDEVPRKSVSKLLGLFKKYEVQHDNGKNDSASTTGGTLLKRPRSLLLRPDSKLLQFRRSLNLESNDEDSKPTEEPTTVISNNNTNRNSTDDSSSLVFLSPMDDNSCDSSWSICSDRTTSSVVVPPPPPTPLFGSTVTDHESVSDRIRRKSFYTRFNELKRPRTSAISVSGTSPIMNTINNNNSSSIRRRSTISFTNLLSAIPCSSSVDTLKRSTTGTDYGRTYLGDYVNVPGTNNSSQRMYRTQNRYRNTSGYSDTEDELPFRRYYS